MHREPMGFLYCVPNTRVISGRLLTHNLDPMWYHIKLKPGVDDILSKTTFWLGGDSEEDIYKILKRKHKINKKDVEWIKKETPPFI